MPRQARIDAPGALHHVIARGIERGKVFRDDADREDFLRRLGELLQQTGTQCYAWALRLTIGKGTFRRVKGPACRN